MLKNVAKFSAKYEVIIRCFTTRFQVFQQCKSYTRCKSCASRQNAAGVKVKTTTVLTGDFSCHLLQIENAITKFSASSTGAWNHERENWRYQKAWGWFEWKAGIFLATPPHICYFCDQFRSECFLLTLQKVTLRSVKPGSSTNTKLPRVASAPELCRTGLGLFTRVRTQAH